MFSKHVSDARHVEQAAAAVSAGGTWLGDRPRWHGAETAASAGATKIGRGDLMFFQQFVQRLAG